MNAVDMIARCGAAQSGEREAQRDAEAAARRVCTLRADERVVPYYTLDEDEELPGVASLVAIGVSWGAMLLLVIHWLF